MKITLIQVGKTEESYLAEGTEKYLKRLNFYCNFQTITIPALKNTKNLSPEEQKRKEAELILKQINPNDFVVLLDEGGKQFTSVAFANWIEAKQMKIGGNLVFVIGGPYGFDENIYVRANEKISLSAMTFSHQMVRLFFVEQLYRAFSIIKGEPYHHS